MPLQSVNLFDLKIFTLTRHAVTIGLLSGLLQSCEIINPAEDIPAYLQISDVAFSTSAGQGSDSHKITDMWIDTKDAKQGVYEMPILFPVLENGPTYLVISAGIMDNGISATRVIYPFYFPDTMTIDLEEKQIYPLTPQFSYRTPTIFSFIEDFEAGNLFGVVTGDSGMKRINDESLVFEGSYSAYIYLDAQTPVYEGRTATSFSIKKGVPVYLELNYRCDQAFEVGLYGSSNLGNVSLYKWNINPKEVWNKIYLNMGEDVKDIDSDELQVQIRAVFDGANTASHIYLDNIKLVNF